MQRYGQIIKIKKEKIEEYKELHTKPYEGVCEMIKECNIQNYSIYLFGEYLFAYFEYIGADFEADMAKMARDESTQRMVESNRSLSNIFRLCRTKMAKYGRSISLRLKKEKK